MKTTADFATASPDVRHAMIVDGYAHLAEAFSKLATEMKVFNGWLATVPSLAEIDQYPTNKLREILKLYDRMDDTYDNLVDQNILHALKFNSLVKYIQQKDEANER